MVSSETFSRSTRSEVSTRLCRLIWRMMDSWRSFLSMVNINLECYGLKIGIICGFVRVFATIIC